MGGWVGYLFGEHRDSAVGDEVLLEQILLGEGKGPEAEGQLVEELSVAVAPLWVGGWVGRWLSVCWVDRGGRGRSNELL